MDVDSELNKAWSILERIKVEFWKYGDEYRAEHVHLAQVAIGQIMWDSMSEEEE